MQSERRQPSSPCDTERPSLPRHTVAVEQTQPESELVKLAQQRQLALDAARMGWWHLDPVTAVVSSDDRFVEIFGRLAHQFLIDDFFAVLHPDDLPDVLAKVEAALDPLDPQPYSAEYRIKLPDGSLRWIEAHGTAQFDGVGDARRATSFVGTVADITERKQADEALRTSREELRRAQAVANCGSWRLNVQRNELLWSDETWRIFGIPPGTALTYETFLGAVHPDDRAYVDGKWSAAMCGQPYDVEHRILVGKQIKWVREKAELDFDPKGALLGGFGTVQDITERKRIEERARLLSEVTGQLLASDQPLRIVEGLCRSVLEHLGCQAFFNFLVDEATGRLHMNACAGISDESARQIEWLDLGVAVCGCVARDGCRIVAEHVQTTPDPRTDLIRTFGIQAYACHPLMNQGRVIGTLSFGSRVKPTFSDDELGLMKAVTDHVAVAMQRIRLLESLEQHARAAEAANEAKSQFLANMSHELRTPMNAILGMIDLALPKAVNPTVRDCLQTAKGSADLLLTLLDDLLDSARIESGRLELEAAPFSLRRLLKQVARILSLRADEKGLRFYCRVPDDLPDAVVGDRMRLQQVLLNLAGNAIKFTDHGDVEITVRVIENQEGGDSGSERVNRPATKSPSLVSSSESQTSLVTLEFAVRDEGIGIPASVQSRLFRPFAQADASMMRRFGGTGLGLSICKSLVEMMGGRIWVQSEVGSGSTFYFAVGLPLAVEKLPEFEPDEMIPTVVPGRLRVLLAEDNPANQKLAAYILWDRGHNVEIAGDGQEAIDLTGQNTYDVVLMDVQMPGTNGLDATAAIRKREAEKAAENGENGRARTPIIAMTAHAMKGDRERCLNAGMDGYISKPIDARELIILVEKLGGASRSTGLAGAGNANRLQGAGRAQSIVFDPTSALQRCLGKPDLLGQMIQFFFDDAEKLLPQVREALQRGELHEMGKLAHRLKGTISHLSADPARKAALLVEHIGLQRGGPAEAEQAVRVLDSECEALKCALLEYQAETGRHEATRSG